MNRSLHILILAAGKGTRFKSKIIKVLHHLMGKSMINIMVDTVSKLKPDHIHMIVGYQKEQVMGESFSRPIDFIEQVEQKGTAHAVMAASPRLEEFASDDILIINGDLPLIRPQTLRPMVAQHTKQGNVLTFMSAVMDNPTGFGRLVYLDDRRIRIIEEKDADPEQRKIKEGNVGIYVFRIGELIAALPRISNLNAKNEYYLTDIIEILTTDGKKVGVYRTPHADEMVGVNDRFEMAKAIGILRLRKIKEMADKGVTFLDPASTWIDFHVEIGSDTVVYPGVVLEGKTVIGKKCRLYPGAHLIDSRIGDRVRILSHSMIQESRIHEDVQVGPFAHLRPKTELKRGSRVGNFVEMKNTQFGPGSKAGHLSYLGDSRIGADVNIGAGTITCNYDGLKKSRTEMGDGVFVGSGTQLVAPVKVGKGAYIGAGSTITKDVSPGALAVTRGRQTEKKGWVARKRGKSCAESSVTSVPRKSSRSSSKD